MIIVLRRSQKIMDIIDCENALRSILTQMIIVLRRSQKIMDIIDCENALRSILTQMISIASIFVNRFVADSTRILHIGSGC